MPAGGSGVRRPFLRPMLAIPTLAAVASTSRSTASTPTAPPALDVDRWLQLWSVLRSLLGRGVWFTNATVGSLAFGGLPCLQEAA